MLVPSVAVCCGWYTTLVGFHLLEITPFSPGGVLRLARLYFTPLALNELGLRYQDEKNGLPGADDWTSAARIKSMISMLKSTYCILFLFSIYVTMSESNPFTIIYLLFYDFLTFIVKSRIFDGSTVNFSLVKSTDPEV